MLWLSMRIDMPSFGIGLERTSAPLAGHAEITLEVVTNKHSIEFKNKKFKRGIV